MFEDLGAGTKAGILAERGVLSIKVKGATSQGIPFVEDVVKAALGERVFRLFLDVYGLAVGRGAAVLEKIEQHAKAIFSADFKHYKNRQVYGLSGDLTSEIMQRACREVVRCLK